MISNSIRIPSPYSIFLSGIALYIFVLIINPSEPNYWGNLEGWSYVFLSFISILFGIAVGSRKIIFEQKTIKLNEDIHYLKKYSFFILSIAFIGVLFQYIDRFIIRDAIFSLDEIFYNRLVVEESGSNIFSIFAALFSPFIFLSFFYFYLLKKIKILSKNWLILISLMIIFVILSNLFLGSRSVIFVYLTLISGTILITNKLTIRPIKAISYFVLSFFALMVINGLLFSLRSEAFGMDAYTIIESTASSYFFNIDQGLIDTIYNIRFNNFIFYNFYLGIINFAQYYIHGLFELFYLVENFDTKNITYGSNNFFIFLKLFAIIKGDLILSSSEPIRTGIFTTFLGPSYYDFGFLGGIFFSFIIAYFFGKIYIKIIDENKISLIPLYLYLAIIFFFASTVSFFVSAQGLYFIVAFSINHLIYNINFTFK